MKMKKLLLPLFLVLMLIGTMMPMVKVNATEIVASGTDGDLDWSIDSNGHLVITGSGDYANSIYSCAWIKASRDYKVVSATIDVDNITNCGYMFDRMYDLKELDLTNLDTSKVTNMQSMFRDIPVETLDLSMFDTRNVTNMEGMFNGCESLTKLDLNNFDTRKVTDMSQMFAGCSSLQSLDVSSFHTSKVNNFYRMFYECKSLELLDLSNFTSESAENVCEMFYECRALSELDVSGFDFSNIEEEINEYCSNADFLFGISNTIGRIKTPKNVGFNIKVPRYIWTGEVSVYIYFKEYPDGEDNYYDLPMNTSKSIYLVRHSDPAQVMKRDGKTIVTDIYGMRVTNNGFVKVGSKYYYVKDGVVQNKTGLVKNGKELWYIKNGVFTKATTLVKYNSTYYYVKNGIYTKATTLIKYQGEYWYVKNGILCKDTTLVKYGSNYWYVKGGTVQKVTTLVKYGDKYYYVQNGKHVKATGLTKYGNDYWYVKNGVVSKETTIVKQGGKYYLVYRGKWHRTYNGTYVWNGVRWKIVKGVVTGRA